MRNDIHQGIPGEMSIDLGRHDSAKVTSDDSGGGQTYRIIQGETAYSVEALDSADFDGATVEEFYGYGDGDGASANTPNGMEASDVSQMFFYEGPEATSLVILHDEPDDGDGGLVTFEFDTLPDEGKWVVPDDRGDKYSRTTASWRWYACCTDGGVYKGGFSGAFWIDIDPTFEFGINSEEFAEPWVVVDGSGSELDRIGLDPTKPITIASEGEYKSDSREAEFTLDLSGDICVESSQSDTSFCVESGPEVTLGPRNCEDLVGGQTPPLASVDITYLEEGVDKDGNRITYSRSIWIGFELRGEPCIWFGEEELGVCAKLEGCQGPPEPNLFDVPSPEDASDIADDILDSISELLPDIRLPPAPREGLGVVIVLGLIALAILALPLEAVAGIALVGIAVVGASYTDSDDSK